jgi:hypothetical protein
LRKKETMFKLTNFTGNGSVPSIGGTPSLAAALVAVDRAEQALEAARSQAKAAARREGRGVKNLFSEGRFVARSSAEAWCATSRAEGRAEVLDAMCEARGLDPKKERARHKAKSEAFGVAWDAHVAEFQATLKAAGYHAALDRGDHVKAAAIFLAACPEFQQSKAEAIVAAGKRARMSASDAGEVLDPEKGSFAARVIAAGRRRRGEV